LQFFIFAGVKVLLEFAAFSLEVPILVYQLFLPIGALTF
jgi:hypothetical protein